MQRYRPIRLILSLVAAINLAFSFRHVLHAELTLIAALNLTVITAALIWPLWLAWRRAERLTPDALRVLFSTTSLMYVGIAAALALR